MGILLTLATTGLIGWATRPAGVDWSFLQTLLASNVHVIGDCLIAAMWPTAAVAIALCFQDDLAAFIRLFAKRGKSLKFPGIELTLEGPDATPIDAPLNKHSVANIYWLGADLMFTVGALLERLEKSYVLHGLQQTIHHLSMCGLAGDDQNQTHAAKSLQASYDEIRDCDDLSDEIRRATALKLVILRNQVGSAVEATQRDYSDGLSANKHLTRDQRLKRLRQ